jgi:hypothetical protein
LKNRGRFFCDGAQGDMIGAPARCWITKGFAGVTLISGEETAFEDGEFAFLDVTTTLKLYTFAATNAVHDTTIEDLIENTSRLAGASAIFPGDTIIASETIGTTPREI